MDSRRYVEIDGISASKSFVPCEQVRGRSACLIGSSQKFASLQSGIAIGLVIGRGFGGYPKTFAGPCTQIQVLAALTAKWPERVCLGINAVALALGTADYFDVHEESSESEARAYCWF
jgi:hypothetical protein